MMKGSVLERYHRLADYDKKSCRKARALRESFLCITCTSSLDCGMARRFLVGKQGVLA